MELLNMNLLQIELIEESGVDAVEWINSYSEHFRQIIECGVTNIDDIKFFLYAN